MARPRSDGEIRSKKITVRVKPSLLELFKKLVEKEKVTQTEWIENIIKEKTKSA
jgi:hypothetical protein